MTQFATPAIQYVGQDDGEGADKGEAADDHVDRVAGGADALLLESGGVIGVGVVVGGNDADGRVVIVKPPRMGFIEEALSAHDCG